MHQHTHQSVGQRIDFPGQYTYLDIDLVALQYKIYCTLMALDLPSQTVT